MKKVLLITAAGCGLLALAPMDGRAEDPQPSAPPTTTTQRVMGDGLLPQTVAIYDADGSGTLSVEEKQAMDADRHNRNETFRQRWDTNHDGRVSPAEESAARAKIRDLIRQRRLQRFSEVDLSSASDHDNDGDLDEPDGFLSPAEFNAINAVSVSNASNPGIASALFNHIDGNKDGLISQTEFLKSLEPQRVDNTGGTSAAAPPPKSRTSLPGD